MTPRKKRILSFIGFVVCGIVLGVVLSFYLLLKLSAPKTSGTQYLQGISAPVEITFDSMGIPQIWAENEIDAFFALGYQQAADRMFQMDLSRRVAAGRLSEMLGALTIDIDITQRRIGHYRIAKDALASLDEMNRQRLGAYTAGVNAYRKLCRALPFEYRFLPILFDEWKPEHTLALLSFQTWFSNSLMSREQFYLDVSKLAGAEKARSLRFPYPDWAPTTVPEPDELGSIIEPKINTAASPSHSVIYDPRPKLRTESDGSPFQEVIARKLFAENSLPLQMTNASNAWVVSPSKSQSGKAMLASDPHLELTRLPQFWYAVGLHTKNGSLNVLGITTPGLPFVVMGHNGQTAYAFTSGGTSLTNFHKEKIHPDDSSLYISNGQWLPFTMITDSISCAGEDSPRIVVHRLTERGPIVEEDSVAQEVYSLSWAGFDIDLAEAVGNGFRLHGSSSFGEFRQVVTGLGALDVNMMYADSGGTIGYQLTSPVSFTSDSSSDSASGPANKINFENLPFAVNPTQGWLASSNNLSTRTPLIPGYYFANRILSIAHHLRSNDQLSVEQMKQFQLERVDRYLLRFSSEAARILDNISEFSWADSMRNWNGSAEQTSATTALICIYLEKLKQLTFEDELGELYTQMPSKWIEQIKTLDSSGWFDDVGSADSVETYEGIAAKAMRSALVEANGRAWGEIHQLVMSHPMAPIPILGDLLDLKIGPHPNSGTPGTLNAGFYRYNGDGAFYTLAGPSWRFVIDLADVDGASMVLPTGNSGNPMSSHFADFFPLWQSGRYWNVPFNYDKVKVKAANTLVLMPDSSTQ